MPEVVGDDSFSRMPIEILEIVLHRLPRPVTFSSVVLG